MMRSLKPRVYLAGKISPGDWRQALVGEACGEWDDGLALNPAHAVELPGFILQGPFFVGCCGHSGAHGPAAHGVGLQWEQEKRQRVFDVSMRRVERADLVFAYVNEVDCFGTLVELGFANARSVPTFLCLGPRLTRRQKDDLWFTQAASTIVTDMPLEQAFHKVLGIWRAARFGATNWRAAR